MFKKVIKDFMDHNETSFSDEDDDPRFGEELVKNLTRTAKNGENCFEQELRFVNNPDEWYWSTKITSVHIWLPFLVAVVTWIVILVKQGFHNNHDLLSSYKSRCQWMFWNLPWLPVTKLFEVINQIKSNKLEHKKPEDYKERKAKLVAQTEMNANIGKI